jgi:predicted glycosyltransferase
MDFSGKKIWIDVEQPKTGVMFNSLFKLLKKENAELLITARDYDATFKILENSNIDFKKIGRHGGETLINKLQTYIDRLKDLLPHVIKFSPDFFVTFSSIEGTRIAYGLKIPSIGINDEPRNEPVCKLLFPFIQNLITPKCIPKELYVKLYADPDKIIRYNGLDEIAWISEYVPNPKVLTKFDVKKGEYLLIRSEPSQACYFIDQLKPAETMISDFLPSIYKEFPNYKYFLLVRSKEQEQYLLKKLKNIMKEGTIIITQYLSDIVDLCFYSSLVISGGGTIVRESSLLNVPSIETFPGKSAPQEIFLIDNGFPLEHIKEINEIAKRSIQILTDGPAQNRFKVEYFKEKIKEFENPIQILFNFLKENLINN